MSNEGRYVESGRRAHWCVRAHSDGSYLHRYGLTLIELLVVIVILTTLVAGVIPILSPNNDSRKIREASRNLQSYIMMTQAEAARTGRPFGIAFQESSASSGVALDVFQLEVPVPFAGFSSNSRATVAERTTNPITYGSAGNGGTDFVPQYDGVQLYEIQFILAAISPTAYDPFPPRMFRIGDLVHVDGNVFMIVDNDDPNSFPNRVETFNGVEYLMPDPGSLPATPPLATQCILLNDHGQLTPVGNKLYRFIRQPANSMRAPLQLPAGVAIDMQGSVQEGGTALGTTVGFPTDSSLNTSLGTPDTIGIMFSPSGGVSSLLRNGSEITDVSRITLLLGRVENGNPAPADYDFSGGGFTNEQLEEQQGKVNWLNLDSRLIAIAARSGRAVVNGTAFVDPRSNPPLDDSDLRIAASAQIEAAHEFAHEMKREGGR